MISINGFHARTLLLSWCAVASIGVGTSAEDVTIPRVPNPPLPADLTNLPGDLRAVAVPGPPNLDEFVSDRRRRVALGKALFWDMQVGSDGVQACASCHFRAGADPRSKNQLSPGLQARAGAGPHLHARRRPELPAQAADFPLTRLAIPASAARSIRRPTATTPCRRRASITSATGSDPAGLPASADVNTRRVEPRNTPSVINAVFNHRQFWDGRAENVFNGVNHLGQRDPNANVFRADRPAATRARSASSWSIRSLASQAVAPIVSTLEMAAPGRTPLDVGSDLARTPRKLGEADSRRPAAREAAGASAPTACSAR